MIAFIVPVISTLVCALFVGKAAAAEAPVAHWRFDEGTGTSVYDERPRTVTGTFMTPNPTWTTDTAPVSFDNPYALKFESTGDGVQFAWPSALNFTGTNERSFSFWYKPTANGENASGNFDRIMSWSGDAFEISGTYGDVAVHRLAFYDGTWRDTGYNLSVGNWYNIMFTYDGTNVKLFVSGVEKFSGTSGGRDINGTLYIGVRHTGDEGINGIIDDVRMFDYALTTDQIDNIVAGSDDPDSSPAPTVSTLSPADNATNISPSSNLVITFSEAVQTGTGTITIKKVSDDSTVETIPATDNRVTGSGSATITINPTTTLTDSTGYYVLVHANAFKNGAGTYYAGISSSTDWNFTSGDFTAPSVSSRSPADNATEVSTTANLVLTFDQATRAGTGTLTIKKASDDSTVETITVSGSQLSGNGTTELTFNPSTTLSEGTSYYVVWTANAFKDSTGNHTAAVTSSTTWNFTTTTPAATTRTEERASGGGGRRSSPGRSEAAPTAIQRSITDSASHNAASSEENESASESKRARVAVTVDNETIVFRDVWTDHWFGKFVKKLAELKIFEGYKNLDGTPKGIYGPEDSITLGQLAKVCTAIVGQTVIGNTSGEAWTVPYIEAAQAMDVSVFTANSIDPHLPATRAEIIQSLLEVLRIPTDGHALYYSDVPAEHPYARAIATATNLGIISGDDGRGTFRPDEPVNRAEVAKIVSMILEAKQ